MKTRHLIALLVMVMVCGCSSTRRTNMLTADQAGAFAASLANEKAQTLYHCQPFSNDAPAQFVHGNWTWHQLKGQGQGDIEATVEFEPNGAKPKVKVARLDSRATPLP
jgi:hypothetical protein